MKDSQEENNTHLDSQRAELEHMSNSLINNLQQMIDEQTKRAQSLASQQHSLSALPSTPPVTDITATHTIPVILEPVAQVAPIAPAKQTNTTPKAATPRSLPPIPQQQAASQPVPRTTPSLPTSTTPTTPAEPKPEWPWKAGKQEKKEEGFGISTIIVILIIGFLMTVCSS